MNSIRRSIIVTIGVSFFSSLLASSSSALTLTQGSIIGEDSQQPGGSVFTLVKYSQTGTVLDTLPLTNTASLGVASGLTIVGSNVFICGTNSTIGQVNLTTGAVGNYFNISSSNVESLGDMNGNLIVGSYSSNQIAVYTTSGTLVNTITAAIAPGITGLDSDGTRIFLGGYNDGNVYVLNPTGTLISQFSTGAGSNSISGLGYDAGSNTLWVSLGFGNDQIRQYSISGTLLSSFPSQYPFIDGLDVVPNVPEPASLMLGGMAICSWIFAAGRKRR